MSDPTAEERAETPEQTGARIASSRATSGYKAEAISREIRQAVAAGAKEEREECAKAIDLFQDIIGWQEGESRNALVCEIRDRIRAREGGSEAA